MPVPCQAPPDFPPYNGFEKPISIFRRKKTGDLSKIAGLQ